jgi:hypothetical protein
MSADIKTVDCNEFARSMGLGPRKFMDALRAGTIPAPLNPAAQKITQYRWASGTVNTFLSGLYKGPMMEAKLVPAARTQPTPAAPRVRGANAEPAGAPAEGRQPIKSPIVKTDETAEFTVKVHTDGTMTWAPSHRKN